MPLLVVLGSISFSISVSCLKLARISCWFLTVRTRSGAASWSSSWWTCSSSVRGSWWLSRSSCTSSSLSTLMNPMLCDSLMIHLQRLATVGVNQVKLWMHSGQIFFQSSFTVIGLTSFQASSILSITFLMCYCHQTSLMLAWLF